MAPKGEIEGPVDPFVIALMLALAARTPLHRVSPTVGRSAVQSSDTTAAGRTLAGRPSRSMSRKG